MSISNKDSLTLTKGVFKEIFSDDHISTVEYLYLLSRFYALGWTRYIPNSVEESLKTKNCLTKNGELSVAAQELILDLVNRDKPPLEQLQLQADWECFWETFPSTDAHSHFPATRKMKDSEATGKSIYYQLRAEHSAEEILNGLINQINNAKNRSFKENQLTYMKNSSRWLRDKEFLVWSNNNIPEEINNSPKNVF